MTKFCPECGEENEDVALFCAKCGHDLKDVDQRMKSGNHAKTSEMHRTLKLYLHL